MQRIDRRKFLVSAGLGAAVAASYSIGARASAKDADVIIIGAGLSGLNAALMLENMGIKVLVLEGRGRIGGRVFTLDDVPGKPEIGGNEIGSTYGRVLDAMSRYGVNPVAMRPRTEGIESHTCMNLSGENILLDDWASHAKNPFPEAQRDVLPWHFEFKTFAPHNPLTNPSQFIEPQYKQFDVSLHEFLTRQGYSKEAIKLGAGTNMGHGNSPDQLSLLMWFNILAFVNMSFSGQSSDAQSPASVAGKGGNQRIPEAMAGALNGEVRTNAQVVGIRSESSQALVQLGDGRQLKAPYVIVTTPFSALRHIELDAPVMPQQQLAINTLDYTRVTQLHYLPKRKFWEEDGLPPSMWTDSVTARFLALRNNPNDPSEITSFVVYANDQMALELDRLGEQAANQQVLARLAKIRPSSKDALEFVKLLSWQKDPYAGGAYAAWKPGQISEFGRYISKPAGRIHFAGEHTSIITRGMEAAMESGERAAFEVANLLL